MEVGLHTLVHGLTSCYLHPCYQSRYLSVSSLLTGTMKAACIRRESPNPGRLEHGLELYFQAQQPSQF